MLFLPVLVTDWLIFTSFLEWLEFMIWVFLKSEVLQRYSVDLQLVLALEMLPISKYYPFGVQSFLYLI